MTDLPKTDAPTGDVTVISEPLTYDRHAPRSYFQDLVMAERGDNAARTRLTRHALEVAVELERRDKAAAQAPDGVEFRVNPSRTTGKGGYFSPPLWLIDPFASVPRPKRALAALVPGFDLPGGVQTVNVPRLTTGTKTGLAADLGAVTDQDVVDTGVTSPVVTIAGMGDVAAQALEQSPPGAHLDWAWFKDLNEDYDAQLEAQVLNGSGTAGQLTGVLNVTLPAGNAVTYTDATPTVPEMLPPLGKAVAAVGNGRKVPPETWLMTTSRWAWLQTGEATMQTLQQQRVLMTVPVTLADAMPVTLGAGGNEDRIVACCPSDHMLFESTPRTMVSFEVLSGTVQARIRLHRYAAYLPGRHPTGTAVVSGTGMVVQSGF